MVGTHIALKEVNFPLKKKISSRRIFVPTSEYTDTVPDIILSDGRIRLNRISEILLTNLLGKIVDKGREMLVKNVLFLQNNASVHKSHIAMNTIRDLSSKIRIT